MKVIDINQKMRQKIIDSWNYILCLESYDFDLYIKKVEELFEIIKNDKDYKYIMGCLVINALVFEHFNKDTDEEYEYDEELLNIDDLNELIGECDFVIFDKICDRCSSFDTLNHGTKKKYYLNTLKYKEKLLEIFPCYLIDLLFYLNMLDKTEIIYIYEEAFIDENKSKEESINISINKYNEFLKEFGKINKDCSLYIISDIITDCYRYLLYLKKNNRISDDEIEILNKIEKNLLEYEIGLLNNDANLKKLLNLYLNYEMLEINERNSVEKYFDMNIDEEELLNYKKVFQTKDLYLTK